MGFAQTSPVARFVIVVIEIVIGFGIVVVGSPIFCRGFVAR